MAQEFISHAWTLKLDTRTGWGFLTGKCIGLPGKGGVGGHARIPQGGGIELRGAFPDLALSAPSIIKLSLS